VWDAARVHVPDSARLHTFGLRGMLIREGEWGLAWMPATTLGVRYKYNDTIWDIDRHLGGACRALGVKDNEGLDYTLTTSKMFAGILPKPFILSAGLRNTEAAQIGFLGFTGDRDTVFEASAVFFITDRILVGGEYRQKPDSLKRFGKLVGREDDWWDLCVGYIVNEHLTLCVGYAHLGRVLNHEENNAWAVQAKWEF